MVGIGGFLNKRAHVWRRVQTGTDDYGQPIYADQIVGAEIPCHIWYTSGSRDENTTNTTRVYRIKAAFFRNAGIKSGDRLEVYDKCGDKFIDGVQIDAIVNRHKYFDCELVEYTNE